MDDRIPAPRHAFFNSSGFVSPIPRLYLATHDASFLRSPVAMANSARYLGADHGSDSATSTPSPQPIGPPSTERLLQRNAVDGGESSVPYAPPRRQEIPAENPEQAIDREIGQSRDLNKTQSV
jgi:hypothetical protein